MDTIKDAEAVQQKETPAYDVLSPLTYLPADLLLMIVEASDDDFQLLAYLLLLGLSSHPHEDSWDSPPAQVRRRSRSCGFRWHCSGRHLAAIVGPCTHLSTLSFTKRANVFSDTDDDSWVDVTFAGHTQLATLDVLVSVPLALALPRILEHLTGLELTLDTNILQLDLTSLLACAPPSLRTLRLPSALPDLSLDDLGDLSLAGSLTQLDAPNVFCGGSESLGRFARLERLHLGPCAAGVAFLGPVAGRLTHLTLSTQFDSLLMAELASVGLCRLVALSLHLRSWGCRYRERFEATLDAMLLDWLEELDLSLGLFRMPTIVSTRLRILRLTSRLDSCITLIVDCPALEVLVLSEECPKVVLRCPRIRSMSRGDKPVSWLNNWDASLQTPDLQRVLGQGTLTRLNVHVLASAFPLRLPDQLRHLVVNVVGYEGPLRVDGAASLLTLSMYARPGHDADVVLGFIDSPRKDGVVERASPVRLDPDSLIDFLAHPGAARLRRVVLPMFKAWCLGEGDADRLAEALSALPRLTDLVLQKLPGPSFSLTCPQLRRLTIRERPRATYALVLDCPRLEACWIPSHRELVKFLPGTTPCLSYTGKYR
ncbi:hypothetical protein PAPYR_10313 [Paratrimastix pyriformis]|uniref:Uncharacterized protein n=1 Tax=Paratrimastix pyriformis TaxID=342808 RepID=A0ABQ8UBW8_9EUKA|nr:hypothetical protein PAPYR_10313 [Paratrimastix pyriformis]